MVAVSESQVDEGETDIVANIEEANGIVPADGHRLPGTIEDGVGCNADGTRQHNHAAATEGHISPARQRRFQGGLVANCHCAIRQRRMGKGDQPAKDSKQ